MLAVLVWTKVDFDRSEAFFLARTGPNWPTDRVSLLFWWFLSKIRPPARAEVSRANRCISEDLPPYIRRQMFGYSTEVPRGSGMPQIFFIYLEKIIGTLPRTRRGLRDQTVICRRIYGGKSSVIQRRVCGAPECLRYFLYI